MSDAPASALELAARTFGPYSLAALFMVGAYFFLSDERAKEVDAAKRRDAREARLVELLEKQHNALTTIAADRMAKIDKKLARIDERGGNLVPTVVELVRQQGKKVKAGDNLFP